MKVNPMEFANTHEELSKIVMRNCVEGHLTVLQAMYVINTYQRLSDRLRYFDTLNRWPKENTGDGWTADDYKKISRDDKRLREMAKAEKKDQTKGS